MPTTLHSIDDSLPADLADKRERLLGALRAMQRVAVAVSGGIDSTVVAMAAFQALGDQAVAVTADSPSVPRAELENAIAMARLIGIHHRVIPTHEFLNDDYLRNDGSRCYHCKSELYSRIEELIPQLGVAVVCSGANLDDLGDYRPGLTAAAEHHVRHPLQEAGFTKADVRALARAWGLPIWDKPASPCLSSRLAPGLAVTPDRVARIEAAEAYLHRLGIRDCRVRLHEGDLARIELLPADIEKMAGIAAREELQHEFRRLGFRFVTMDLAGLRSGSMNELIDVSVRRRYANNAD
jgi:uncharacterized protein